MAYEAKSGGRDMSMTKKDIVLKIAAETGVKQIDVKKVVQRTLDHIVVSLERGETVELRNFGVFKVRQRRGRLGRNPRTGQEVPVPPKKVVVFKPGLQMKGLVK
jgi:nucleoid DNA-binding protein